MLSGIKNAWIRQTFTGSNTLRRSMGSTNKVEFQKSVSTDRPFEKILIANRGEIACRIIRTCRKMGIRTVAIHSEADAHGLFVHQADESVCIGPPPTGQSYLQIERIVNAAKMTGAQAVHPGFGFLSENNMFAAALENEKIVFIGPRSHSISIMGDKISSKNAARKAGVSVIPGDSRIIKDVEECKMVAKTLGYPVMVKATAGGGGKGMRIAWSDNDCEVAFRLATNEAVASFGDDRLFVEKFIEQPRHVEIQILGDTFGNVVFLNERECSIQRRNQKVYEEAPSCVSTPELRKAMGAQACQLAKAVDYITAGTCEFLVDKNRNFYFLEMNTRLQVEHPITEMITGVDLVEQMINIAAGKPLPFKQSDIGINGWALEARVYAEDPFKEFLPQTGTLRRYREPAKGPNVRVDSGIQEYSEISTHYDPMISKLVTWGKTRQEALDTMATALDSYVIHGLNHNVPFLRSILDHPRFKAGDINTKFIQDEYPEGFSRKYLQLKESEVERLYAAAATTFWKIRRDFSSQTPFTVCVTFDQKTRDIVISNDKEVKIDGKSVSFTNAYERGNYFFDTLLGNEKAIVQLIKRSSHHLVLQYKGIKYDFEVRTPKEQALQQYMPQPEVIDEESVLLAPMPGNIFSINIKEGDKVAQGREICVIEAMKMQNIFYARKDGVVKKVYVKQGDAVQAEQKIYELE